MKIYFAGNFPSAKGSESERSLAHHCYSRGSTCHRLLSFFWADKMKGIIEYAREVESRRWCQKNDESCKKPMPKRSSLSETKSTVTVPRLKKKYRLKKDYLLKAARVLYSAVSKKGIIPQFTKLHFQPGKITAYNGQFAASIKADIDFEYLVPAKEFLNFLRSANGGHIEISTSDEGLIFSADHSNILFHPSPIKVPGVDIWHQNADWFSCPEDILEAIRLVEPAASRNMLKKELTNIHISGRWVAASNEYWACRYKLQTTFPVDMMLFYDSAKLFKKTAGYKLARVSIFNPENDLNQNNNQYIFDFGSLRLLCVGKGDKILVPEINSFFKTPNIVSYAIPSNIQIAPFSDRLKVSFSQDQLIIRTEKKGAYQEKQYTIESAPSMQRISFYVKASQFLKVIKASHSIGYKRLNKYQWALHLISDRCENLIFSM